MTGTGRMAKDDERGASLILAIVFMVVVGGIVGGTLAMVSSGLKNRAQLDQARDREYAADGAIEYAIAQVRTTGGTGPGLSSCGSPFPLTYRSDPDFQIPELAVTYFRMPEGKRTMKDLIYQIRADEAVHRGVNHTLSNLDQKEDPNPFVSDYKIGKGAHQHKPNPALKPTGYERDEVIG